MMTPLVTVLMSVYNGEKYLREAVESILYQTYKNIEFLIIDDGSTDGSLDILRGYDDKRIKLVINKINKGLIFSLNKGVQLSRGKYIARMDCDDVSSKSRLEKQVAFLENHRNVGVCGTWLSFFTRVPGLGGKFCPIADSDLIKSRLIFENVIQHPTVMMRSSVVKKYRYPSEYLHAEDYAFWVELIGKTDFAIIPEILFHYRLHKSQIGQTKTQIQKKSVERIHAALLSKIGIKSTREDLILHEKICLGNYEYSESFVERSEKWIQKIQKINLDSKFLNQSALEKVLASRWLSICLMHSRLKKWIWTKYSSSSLGRLNVDNLMEVRQLWLESIFFPALRPIVIKVKNSSFVKRIVLG